MNGIDEGYQRRFSLFLDSLERGTKVKDAFRASFGDPELSALEVTYRQYLSEVRLNQGIAEYRLPPPARPDRERPMSNAEVHVLWSRVEGRRKDMAQQALKELGEAIALDPGSAEARLHRGMLLMRDRRMVEAKADLEAALAAGPEDPRSCTRSSCGTGCGQRRSTRWT